MQDIILMLKKIYIKNKNLNISIFV